jgi:hypothetical protein
MAGSGGNFCLHLCLNSHWQRINRTVLLCSVYLAQSIFETSGCRNTGVETKNRNRVSEGSGSIRSSPIFSAACLCVYSIFTYCHSLISY